MNVQEVFRGISKQLYTDFEISRQIRHNASTGDFRENRLKEFLKTGRLPMRYGVGNGEIVGKISEVSRQSDLIIFDQLNSIPLLYDEKVQVYPIDCVYGIIEVKSQLSKTKLIESLENIKSVKEITPRDTVVQKNLGFQQSYLRPMPFGFIFAYSLGDNSLESLTINLKEWEDKNPSLFWPNLICVLGAGIIYHTDKKFGKNILSSNINDNCIPTYIAFKEDALFHFYSYLLDSCNSVVLPKLELSDYLNPPQKIGEYIVSKNFPVKLGQIERGQAFNEELIARIVNWCQAQGTITTEEMYMKILGQVPQNEDPETLKTPVYFYNPERLLGFHEVSEPIKYDKNRKPYVTDKLAIPFGFIEVNQETYYYPFYYLNEYLKNRQS